MKYLIVIVGVAFLGAQRVGRPDRLPIQVELTSKVVYGHTVTLRFDSSPESIQEAMQVRNRLKEAILKDYNNWR